MPGIDRVRSMSPQELYQIREELNQQVLREEEMQDKNVVPLQTTKRSAAPGKRQVRRR